MSILNDCFERIVVINLPSRNDRRRQMEAQLRNAGVRAEFFPGILPNEQSGWPSLGAHGFLSHRSVHRAALDSDARSVLVLEDDLDFRPDLANLERDLAARISPATGATTLGATQQSWDFLYLGHFEAQQRTSGTGHATPDLLPWTAGLRSTHFYAVGAAALPRLVAYLDEVAQRPAGHPLGGPQHIDGALTMFRAQNPDLVTLIADPPRGWQRSSRSDITFHWFDRLPVLRQAADMARSARRLARSLASNAGAGRTLPSMPKG